MDGYETQKMYDGVSSIEAEQAVLCALLHGDMSIYMDVKDIINPDDFYLEEHTALAKAMWSRYGFGLKVDPIIIKNRFKDKALFEGKDVAVYIAELVNAVSTISVAPEYAKLVRDMAYRRRMMQVCEEALNKLKNLDSDDMADDIQSAISSDFENCGDHYALAGKFITLKEAGNRALDRVGTEEAMGMSTGLTDLDQAIKGFQRGKFYVGAGRPGMFKSGTAANFVRNIARNGGKCGMFSLEMSSEENGERALSDANGLKNPIEYRDIQGHEISEQTLKHLKTVAEDLPDNVLIDETAGITITLLEKRARAMMKQLGGLDFIMIDYVQLMGDHDIKERGMTRAQSLAIITKRLKGLSKSLNCAVFTLAQIKQGVDMRENKRPKLGDLSDSASLANDADVVMFFYREEYYLRQEGKPDDTKKALEYDAALSNCMGKMEIIIGKQRSGPKKTVKVAVNLGTDTVMDLHVEEATPSFDL